MRITIETTNIRDTKRSVTIEQEYDDFTLSEVMEDFVIPLLRAYGYSEKTIDQYFKD